MTDELPEWCHQLRAARLKLGLSRAALAAKANVSARTIFNWECGLHVPHYEHRHLVGSVLGIHPDDHLTYFGPTYQDCYNGPRRPKP